MSRVSLESIIKRSPYQLDTFITKLFSEAGVELSGGEHQRLALARTFYRECSVCILDEPSSALDPKAEQQLFEYLQDIGKKQILIFTSHRLSNISIANKIIVMDNGEIVEQGTKEYLLTRQGYFNELYSYQHKNS